MIEQMLNSRQAADICGIPYRTWQSCYQVWGVPHFRLGRAIRFRESELAQWIESRRDGVSV